MTISKERKKGSLIHRVKTLLLLGCVFAIVSCSLPNQYQPPFQSPTQKGGRISTSRNVDALVTMQQEGIRIPEDFIGFSIELSQICEIIRLDEQKPEYYEHLYENLGVGVLHIGGHSGDYGMWVPNGISSCSPTHTIVTKALIDAIFAFASRIHWKVIWGLNLIANDPQSATNEAAYIATAGKLDLIGFTIGNEPELYVEYKARPPSWRYANFLYEWERYKNAIRKNVPTATFIGPEACCETPFFPNFLLDEGKGGDVLVATHHDYNGNALVKSFTASYLLRKQTMQQFVARATRWVALARNARLPLEISESNTFSGGGTPGVSDSFAATLWASDYLFQAAELGIRRIDFQSSQMAVYDAIDDNGTPKPLYYGLLFFHTIAERARIVQTTIQTSLNITAYAVKGSDGSFHVVLINKDSSSSFALR